MKVAAYQSSLAACRTIDALRLIREQVDRCESLGVEVLCCPERILGGLADYSHEPTSIAIDVAGGQLRHVLAPLASDTVTTILGFTEIDPRGRLYNAAAVFRRGFVVGLSMSSRRLASRPERRRPDRGWAWRSRKRWLQ